MEAFFQLAVLQLAVLQFAVGSWWFAVCSLQLAVGSWQLAVLQLAVGGVVNGEWGEWLMG